MSRQKGTGMAGYESNEGATDLTTPRQTDSGVGNYRVLVYGLDKLIGTIDGEVWNESLEHWHERVRHEIALATDEGRDALPLATEWVFGPPGDELPLYAKPFTSRGWSVMLANEWGTIQLRRGKSATNRYAKVELSAAACHCANAIDTVGWLDGWVLSTLGDHCRVVPSEIHLFADIVAPVEAFAENEWQRFVKPSGMIETERSVDVGEAGTSLVMDHSRRKVYGQLSSLTFGGHGSALQVQMYDKRHELRSSRKVWQYDEWREQGWDGEEPVTRLECRFRRDLLRELHYVSQDGEQAAGINDLYELLDALPTLWAYGLAAVRLIQCGPGATPVQRSRAPQAAIWVLARAAFDASEVGRAKRYRTSAPLVEQLYKQAVGCVVAAAALSGVEPSFAYFQECWRTAVAEVTGGDMDMVARRILMRRDRWLASQSS